MPTARFYKVEAGDITMVDGSTYKIDPLDEPRVRWWKQLDEIRIDIASLTNMRTNENVRATLL